VARNQQEVNDEKNSEKYEKLENFWGFWKSNSQKISQKF
jgi:hypothetical protein